MRRPKAAPAPAPPPIAHPHVLAKPEDSFSGIAIRAGMGTVTDRHSGTRCSLAGAHATVETTGQIDSRITVTRLATTGVFALGLRKKQDNRQLFLQVRGSDGAFAVELEPSQEAQARGFASRINAAASRASRQAARKATVAPSPPDDPIAQVKRLAELHAAGVLTDDEFSTKKADLLGRL